MTTSVINILDLVEEIGIDATQAILADFSTQRKSEEQPRNRDIEHFLKQNAIQFAKEKKSITYLVGDEETGLLLGYFTITHKAIEIVPEGMSKSKLRMIEKYARLHEKLDAFVVSAFLIAQFGKNYAVDNGNQISGDELMALADRELKEIQHRIGGGIKYLDCEANAKLIHFYQDRQGFRLFGERISEKDGKRYLQFMKFI